MSNREIGGGPHDQDGGDHPPGQNLPGDDCHAGGEAPFEGLPPDWDAGRVASQPTKSG